MAESRHDHSISEERAVAIELARMSDRLDGIKEELARLADRYDDHADRIGKIEGNCAAHQAISVGRTKVEISFEGQIKEMDERVRDLETYRDESVGAGVSAKLESMDARVTVLEAFKHDAGGAMRATLGVVRDGMMILTFALTAWYMVGERATHQHEPAAQHQTLK